MTSWRTEGDDSNHSRHCVFSAFSLGPWLGWSLPSGERREEAPTSSATSGVGSKSEHEGLPNLLHVLRSDRFLCPAERPRARITREDSHEDHGSEEWPAPCRGRR